MFARAEHASLTHGPEKSYRIGHCSLKLYRDIGEREREVCFVADDILKDLCLAMPLCSFCCSTVSFLCSSPPLSSFLTSLWKAPILNFGAKPVNTP